jgi:hypothetical protein
MRDAVDENLGALLFAALRQLDEHRHDPHEHVLARLVPTLVEQRQTQANVEQGG